MRELLLCYCEVGLCATVCAGLFSVASFYNEEYAQGAVALSAVGAWWCIGAIIGCASLAGNEYKNSGDGSESASFFKSERSDVGSENTFVQTSPLLKA